MRKVNPWCLSEPRAELVSVLVQNLQKDAGIANPDPEMNSG
jgi:hypothetical protein